MKDRHQFISNVQVKPAHQYLNENAKLCHTLSLTAFNSPKFPFFAKCALRLALELPAHTPHRERRTLENDKMSTLAALGKTGDRQSRIMAVSLKMSAANRYILHSGSNDVPSLCANSIVAIRPMLSCKTLRSNAAVGLAEASPTPTPVFGQRSSSDSTGDRNSLVGFGRPAWTSSESATAVSDGRTWVLITMHCGSGTMADAV
jgi:hypothetical protein